MQVDVRPRLEAWAWGTSPGDLALAVAVTVVVLSEFRGQAVASPLLAALVGVPVLLSLAWRRRFPVPVAVAVCAFELALAVTAPGPYPPQFSFIAVLIAVYSCATWTAGRQAVVGGAVTFLLITAAHLLTADGNAGDFLPWLVFGAPWFTGRLVRRRTLQAADAAVRASELEQHRDAAIRDAAAAERARIARELHDVVAHAVSVIVVQAGAERLRLADADSSTGVALQAIESTGRQALTELRTMLAVLREGQGDGSTLAPQPDVAQLPALVGSLRAAGLPVQLQVSGAPQRELPAGLGLSVYRIVQEALTNVLKHAPGAQTFVDIEHTSSAVRLEIRNDAAPIRTPQATGNGRGLVGMRERAALHGGTLNAQRFGTGWRVTAELPVRDTALT